MTAPRSTHLPEVAGAIEVVTGTLLVDTGLRDVQAFSATLAQASAAGAAIVTATLQPLVAGTTLQLLIAVFEDDAVTPAIVAANVSWLAVGK